MDAGRELKELMLRAPRLTLAAAESMTCGRVQARVGEISGASDFFLGGITAYTLDEKVRHLGVNRAAARRVNCVSAGVAEQMARGACRLFGSDFGVATTGYSEPFAAGQGAAVGAVNRGLPSRSSVKAGALADPFAWWAIAVRHGCHLMNDKRRRGRTILVRSGRVECPGATRVDAQIFVADAVLVELIAWLREVRG